MKRFKLIGGVLMPPPHNGTDTHGEVISNFDGRIASDASFAEENGYYPKSDALPQMPDDGISYWQNYHLENGRWEAYYEPCEPVGIHVEKKRITHTASKSK